jgi:signal transduction histidine kinase
MYAGWSSERMRAPSANGDNARVSAAEFMNRVRGGIGRLKRASGPPPRPVGNAQRLDAVSALLLTVFAVAYAVQYRGADAHRIAPSPDPPAPPGEPLFQTPLGIGVETFFLIGLSTLPLAVRRRYPLAALWVVVLGTIGLRLTASAQWPELVAVLIAAYTVAAYSQYRVAAVISLVLAVLAEDEVFRSVVPNIAVSIGVLLFAVPITVAGNAIRTWRARVAASQERMRAMELEQQEATRRAVELERSRIARELHDVVTHNVSVMVVQAGAARKVMEIAPEQATEALLAVEATGRAAMAELRQAMGLLSAGATAADDGELMPQPGVDQLDTLVGRVRDAGLPVTLAVTGTPRPLPPGIALAAYRVVQEALTNTVKHAAGASAHVAVTHEPTALRLEITDTGGTPGRTADTGNGRGLLGLHERLAVYGGTLEAEQQPDGGFRVLAVIPLAEGDLLRERA